MVLTIKNAASSIERMMAISEDETTAAQCPSAAMFEANRIKKNSIKQNIII
jgi:hypothetical protein